MNTWIKKAPVAVTVCDRDGKITEMNGKAAAAFAKYGGADLVGKSLFDCHNENSRGKLRKMFADKTPNVYTIEKRGVKKLIYQFPWEDENGFAGYVELSVELPAEMPNFVRE
ncbi:MAG: diguanylate cyclase [Elusimicrobia bacterium CG08_land_8_20_14_0_20_51_18]|nr:MAG: diguanylate cyclase [Elusimicrobia bacterium CG08_land_8_20_14_0_20_51_18]